MFLRTKYIVQQLQIFKIWPVVMEFFGRDLCFLRWLYQEIARRIFSEKSDS